MKMRIFLTATLATLSVAQVGGSANACMASSSIHLKDVELADVVVVGQIKNYEIVEDRHARQARQEMFERNPRLREIIGENAGFLSDYARFDIVVDEVLHGDARNILTVTWNNSTFGEPDSLPNDTYLIALRSPASPLPSLRGPSATIIPNPEQDRLTVLQAPCAGPFLFESSSANASIVRQLLRADIE